MIQILLWIFLLVVLLSIVHAYLCTLLFKWNDRKKGTNKSTIRGKIEQKIKSAVTAKQSKSISDNFKSYLFSYVTIFTYTIAWLPSQTLRKFFYKRILGCRIGSNSCIHIGVKMLMPHRISIGDNCIVGESCFFDGRMFLEINNNINFSTGVTIWTMQHDAYSSFFDIEGGPVVVNDNVWLSFKATVLPNIVVAKNCVVGAHSLLTKSTNEEGIYFGIPAKEVRKRNTEIRYKLSPMGFFY